MLDKFHDLDREMRARFSELAQSFDFSRAEHEAIESVQQVHRLAEKARTILEDEFDYQPEHRIFTNAQAARMEGEIADLRSKYLAVECEIMNFLTNLGFYGPEGSTAPANPARAIAVTSADLARLAQMVDFVRGGASAHDDTDDTDQGVGDVA